MADENSKNNETSETNETKEPQIRKFEESATEEIDLDQYDDGDTDLGIKSK